MHEHYRTKKREATSCSARTCVPKFPFSFVIGLSRGF